MTIKEGGFGGTALERCMASFAALQASCSDLNDDGLLSVFDIDPFVLLLTRAN